MTGTSASHHWGYPQSAENLIVKWTYNYAAASLRSSPIEKKATHPFMYLGI